MNKNIYVDLTNEFNTGKLRAILSSGQAVVLHELAVMSKDGDWILRENQESLKHILTILEKHGARYRFGAPLDVQWLSGGWSSHFEFQHELLRVRTDFVTRPPRINAENLTAMWREQEHYGFPFTNIRDLIELKKTNREKDYAVIGELSRLLTDVSEQLLLSRSAKDLIQLAKTHGDLVSQLVTKRPLLNEISSGIDKLEAALDAERRALMHKNENRLAVYMEAAEEWVNVWPKVAKEIAMLPLLDAHSVVAERAAGVLPYKPL